MSESVNFENKKQNHLKPPRSVTRIVFEILAGTAIGFAVGLPVGYVTGTWLGGDCTGNWRGLITFVLVFFMVHGLGTAVGVYLVGNIGKQTSSFLLTLGWSFLGVVVFGAVFCGPGFFFMPTREGTIVQLALGLLIPPIFATIGFNLRRRYK